MPFFLAAAVSDGDEARPAAVALDGEPAPELEPAVDLEAWRP